MLCRRGGYPLGQRLADFIGGDSSASFRVPNAFINGGERFLVFFVGDGSGAFEFELLRLRHRVIVGHHLRCNSNVRGVK